MSKLLQILEVTVPAMDTVVTAHQINVGGVAKRPDFVAGDRTGVTISANTTQVEVTNLTAAAITVNVWLEYKHSLVRELGYGVANMTPRPFVVGPNAYDGDTIYSRPMLVANIAADGTTTGTPYNVANVAHVGASGVYVITLTEPVPNVDNAIVTFGMAGGAGPIAGAAFSWDDTSHLRVTTRDPATNAVLDAGFCVNVMRSV